jgi:hypothetical protein
VGHVNQVQQQQRLSLDESAIKIVNPQIFKSKMNCRRQAHGTVGPPAGIKQYFGSKAGKKVQSG